MDPERLRIKRDPVEDLLPAFYVSLLRAGKAALFRDSKGLWLCYEKGCFKLFRKDAKYLQELVVLLADSYMTVSEIARHLGLPYRDAYGIVYYYYKAGLLKRQSSYYTLNEDHPQIQFYTKRILSVHSLILKIPKNSQKLLKNEPVHSEFNKNERVEVLDPEKIVERARQILRRPLTDAEILIILRLAEWKQLRGKWYVCAQSPEELSDLLNISTASSSELAEALRELEKQGVVYRFYDRRNRQHCFRISKALVEQQ